MIQFAFQNWSTEHDWWIPNTISPDMLVDGVKALPPTHSFQWFEIPEVFHDQIFGAHRDELEAFNYPAKRDEFLYSNDNVRYSLLSTLDDKKYIYPICIRNTSYFNDYKNIGFDLIDPKVFADVKAGRAKIVLLFPLEGTSGSLSFENDYEILNGWCIKHGLKRNQVYYIHGNCKGPISSVNFNFTPIVSESFICWVPQLLDQPIAYRPSDKFFLSYNRRPRPHRVILLCEIIKRNLVSKGLISYWGDDIRDSVSRVIKHGRPDLEPQALNLDKLIPLEIDKNLGQHNPAWDLIPEHYQQTFLSVLPETLFDVGTIFFSEKTWKTIVAGHPFIMIGSPGMLKELRNQGYYTFGSFWDESYDNEPDLGKRIQMAMDECYRLSFLSDEKLMYLREQMLPILIHNQQLFNERHRKKCLPSVEQGLFTLVEQIWNLF